MLEFNGTAIVIAISFIIFVILENFIFYKPMQKMLNERENYITENETEAEKNLSQIQALIDEKDKKLANANSESAKILNDASLEYQEKYDAAVAKAKTDSNEKINNLKEQLENEKEVVQQSLKQDIGIHAANIVSKILKKEVSMVNVNDEILDKAMKGEL